MIRTKDRRWILQKNINSSSKIIDFAKAIASLNNNISYDDLIHKLNEHTDRSNIGSTSTIGVRLSQLAFYMVGYKANDKFIPSIITQKLMNGDINEAEYGLLSLFSTQYPHPYSETNSDFNIYIGRFILSLLLDNRIDNKIYIDEFIWILVFVTEVTESIYEDIIEEILSYRKLSYKDKKNMFENVSDYNDVFSNVTHEVNYYFLRIYQGLGVFDIVCDQHHNEGNLFSFKHGKGKTFRNDAYMSRANKSGYVRISDDIAAKSKKLLEKFSLFDKPISQNEYLCKSYLLKEMYEFKMIDLLEVISNIDHVDKTINEMIHLSVNGSNDGKDFEVSVKNVFDLFEDIKYTEIISGSGDTDIICILDSDDKINIDSKKSKKSLSQINPSRIKNHIEKNGSKYAIIVTSVFARGANKDISGYNIVNLDAETLGVYILKLFNGKKDIMFSPVDMIIENNLGSNISNRISALTDLIFQ
jgi:hypothetical protein